MLVRAFALIALISSTAFAHEFSGAVPGPMMSVWMDRELEVAEMAVEVTKRPSPLIERSSNVVLENENKMPRPFDRR